MFYTSNMKLIIGLGNPEPRYDNTRHNVGFAVLDDFARENSLVFKPKSRFHAEIAENDGFVLAKPTTYYNSTGESVRALADFYKVNPEYILVVHDEMMLPFGTLRTRRGGGHAGNNGIKSITAHLGPDTNRLRVGIWNERRNQIDDADFVLSKLSAHERKQFKSQLSDTRALIEAFIKDSFPTTTIVG